MTGFRKLDGEFAITKQDGVFRQADVYERNGYLFVAHGNGFVQLQSTGGTSSPKVNLDELNMTTPVAMNPTGRLCIEGHPAVSEQKPLPDNKHYLIRAQLPALDDQSR